MRSSTWSYGITIDGGVVEVGAEIRSYAPLAREKVKRGVFDAIEHHVRQNIGEDDERRDFPALAWWWEVDSTSSAVEPTREFVAQAVLEKVQRDLKLPPGLIRLRLQELKI